MIDWDFLQTCGIGLIVLAVIISVVLVHDHITNKVRR